MVAKKVVNQRLGKKHSELNQAEAFFGAKGEIKSTQNSNIKMKFSPPLKLIFSFKFF